MAREGEIHGGGETQAVDEVGEAFGAGSLEGQRDQLVGFRIRQRLEQDAVEHAEDRGVGANADGEGEQDSDGETGRPAQATPDEFQIGQDGLQGRPLPGFAASLLEEADIAECAAGGLFSLGAGHAFRFQFVGTLGNVFLNGDRKIVVTAPAGEERKQGHGDLPTAERRLEHG